MERAAIYQRTTKPIFQFKARIEKGVLVSDQDLSALSGHSYIVMLMPDQAETTDALDVLAALAQPIGPSDLARNFGAYTERTIVHESPESDLR